MIVDLLQRLGHETLKSLAKLGRGHLFIAHALTGLADLVRRPGLLVSQV